MLRHGVDQLAIGQGRIIQPQFLVHRLVAANRLTHGNARVANKRGELIARQRRFQVFNDFRADAGLFEALQYSARRPAAGVMVDRGHEAFSSLLFQIEAADMLAQDRRRDDPPSEACWPRPRHPPMAARSEEHTSELQALMRRSYDVLCLKKKKTLY